MTGEVVTGTRGAAGDRRCGQRRGAAGAGGAAGRGADRAADARARPRRSRGRAGRAARAEGQGRAGSRVPAAARARRAGAAARGAVRRTRARARARPGGLGAGAGRAALRAGHGRRRCRRRQVAARRGALASIEATVVRGRCLPYGEGITYWPVVEVLKQLDAAARRTRPPRWRSARCSARREAATSAEEIAWAFRKTLEQAAAERPLVVVFDDIQWGEETFLDLIEHVALLSSGAAILLLCIARPELIERRPAWPVTLRLEPLGDEDVDELIPERIAGELRDEDRSGRGRQPALRRGDAGDGRRGGRRGGRPAHPAGAARGAPRPARDGRAERARAGRDRGRDLPPRRRAGARAARRPR